MVNPDYTMDNWMGCMTFDPRDDIGKSCDLGYDRILVTSDTHFSHRNILVYEAENRPFKDRDEMDQSLIERWNSKVGPGDLVIHCGDFAFAGKTKISELTAQLNGDIWLILGNHDREKGLRWTDLGFKRVFERPFMLDGKFVFSHEPLVEIPDGKVNVYGHVHGSKLFETYEPNRYCVCVERHGCAPIALDDIYRKYPQ